MVRSLAGSLFLLGFFVLAGPARADDGARYFVKMYGFENWRNAAAYSHTYGSFFRVGADQSVVRVDISWIPQDPYMPPPGDLRMPAFGDYPGQNVSIPTTNARASGAFPARSISVFGPYEIAPQLFYAELAQSRRLFSGQVTYRGLDMQSRPESVNCVHAVAMACGDFRTGIFLRGPSASSALVEFCAEAGLVNMVPQPEWSSYLDSPSVPRIGCDPMRSDGDISTVDCSAWQQ